MLCGETLANKNICIELTMHEGSKFKVKTYLYSYPLFWFQCSLVLEVDKVHLCYIQLFDHIVSHLNSCSSEIKIHTSIL